jgi:predicted dehydrogenase
MTDRAKYSKPIRWGIIGCGNVTEVKSGPAYKKTDGFQLTAVMRRDFDKLKDYARRHDIKKYYTDADELINDDEIDAVYIATPPDTHMYYALKVAEAGKPCCIEKPLAPCYKDSLAIHEAFKDKNVPLFVAYYRRSLPRFNQVNTWLKNKDIGEIRHISWHLSKAPNDMDLSGTYNWRTDPKVAPGGYFDDLASHGLDLFTFLLGNIKEVYGISLNQQQLYSAKDAFTACWLHESGVTGSGSWNFGCDSSEDRVEILGSKGKIQFSVFKENPLILMSNNNEQEFFIKNPINIQLHHVENMKKQLFDENFVHPSNGSTAVHTSWVMDKILGKTDI